MRVQLHGTQHVIYYHGLLNLLPYWCSRHLCVRTCIFVLTASNQHSTKQVLKVIASHDDGWYLVQNSHGAFGVVPGNYLFVSPKVCLLPFVF